MSATITAFPATRSTEFTTTSFLAPTSVPAGDFVSPRRSRVAADVRETRARTGAGTLPVRSHLHLTRRGRVVLTLAVVLPLLGLLGAFMLDGGGAAATSSTGHVHFQHVTVASGETLWQVAEQVAPNSDPRDVIDDIVRLNDLSTTDVMAGQSIAIPTQYTQAN